MEIEFLTDKEGCSRPSSDEKPFREQILEANKFIVGSSCQLLITFDNIHTCICTYVCHVCTYMYVMYITELAITG